MAGTTFLSGIHFFVRDVARGLQNREEPRMACNTLGIGERNVGRMAERDRPGRSIARLIGHIWRQPQLSRSFASADGRTGKRRCQNGSDE
jgi:hypothetical protein